MTLNKFTITGKENIAFFVSLIKKYNLKTVSYTMTESGFIFKTHKLEVTLRLTDAQVKAFAGALA